MSVETSARRQLEAREVTPRGLRAVNLDAFKNQLVAALTDLPARPECLPRRSRAPCLREPRPSVNIPPRLPTPSLRLSLAADDATNASQQTRQVPMHTQCERGSFDGGGNRDATKDAFPIEREIVPKTATTALPGSACAHASPILAANISLRS